MAPDEFFTEGLGLRGAAHSEACTLFHLSSAAVDAEFDENTSLAESLIVDVWIVSFFFSAVGGRGRKSDLTEEGDMTLVVRPVLPTIRIGEDCDATRIGYGSPLGCEK